MSLWPAFLDVLSIVAELGAEGSDREDAPLVVGVLAGDPRGCEAACEVLESLAFSDAVPMMLAKAASGFDRERLMTNVAKGASAGIELVRTKAAALLLARADPERTRIPVLERDPGGPEVRGEAGTTQITEEPPKTPPTAYGEILDDANGYAISIDVVHCITETSDGPGSDEISWVADITQVFNNPSVRVVETLVSREYQEFDDGDQYSAIPSQIVSDDRGHGFIDFQTDDRLCPRLWQPADVGGTARLTRNTLSVFNLDHFDLCRVQLRLVEVDKSKTVDAIISIFTTLLNLGLQSAGGLVGLGNAIAAATGASTDGSIELVQQLRTQILQLLSQENDPLGKQTAIIRRADIRSAFSSGTPASVDRYGFSTVRAPGKSLRFTGDDGDYTVHLRYERWGTPT